MIKLLSMLVFFVPHAYAIALPFLSPSDPLAADIDAKLGTFKISDDFQAPFHQEIWYRVSHSIQGAPATLNGGACILSQWKAGSTAPAPIVHVLEGGSLKGRISFALSDDATAEVITFDFFSLPAPAGDVHDFVYRVKWPDGGLGLVEAWHNGKYIGLYRGPLGYRGEGGPSFTSELTCGGAPVRGQASGAGLFRRGSTMDAVLNAGEVLETPTEYVGFN